MSYLLPKSELSCSFPQPIDFLRVIDFEQSEVNNKKRMSGHIVWERWEYESGHCCQLVRGSEGVRDVEYILDSSSLKYSHNS